MQSYPSHIEIGEHKVPLPPLPKDKSKILNIDKKDYDSVWSRVQFPDIWFDFNRDTKVYQKYTEYDQDDKLISLSVEDSKLLNRLQLEDLDRRMNGVHCKINDQIVWIAPDYYHNLQWCEMKDLPEKFGGFRWIQNDVMILWWAVRTLWHKWCAGLMVPKAKKTGITQIASGAFCNELTLNEGFEMGAASKEFDHAKDVFMAYFFHAFDNMPYIIQPDVRKRNLSEIVLGTPPRRAGSKSKFSQSEYDKYDLNSRLKAYKTKSNCFDGPVLKRGFIDELPKWWESSSVHPDTVLTKNVEAVKIQDKINGQLLIGSYMPEIDDAGFYEFRDWVLKSKLKTANKITGRTNSNLIMFAMTAVESYESCFNRFGKCDQAKAYHSIKAELDGKVKLSDQMAFRRQYPRDENDMFDSGGRGTTFDNIRLAQAHRELTEQIENNATPYLYCRVQWQNKEWEEGVKKRPEGVFDNVQLIAITEQELRDGKRDYFELRVKHHNLEQLEPYFNQVFRRRNRHEEDDAYCPLDESTENYVPAVASWDPVDYVLKRDIIDGSTNAGYFGWLFDSRMDAKFKKPITRSPIIEYIFRHEDPDTDYENLVKLILLTGCRILVESNKQWVITKLKKDKLHHFLLVVYPDGIIREFKLNEDSKPVSATEERINNYIRAIKRFWREPKTEGEVDYLKEAKSPILYEQAMNFDPKDTKRFDVAVAYGWYCVAYESFNQLLEDKEKDEGGPMNSGAAYEAAINNLLNL